MKKIKQAFFFFPAALKITAEYSYGKDKKVKLLPSCRRTGNLIAKVSSRMSERAVRDRNVLIALFELSWVTQK